MKLETILYWKAGKPYKIILSIIGCMMAGFLFSGCINWAHVVEHNQLRTIEEHVRNYHPGYD
jgi:hypothetical protein